MDGRLAITVMLGLAISLSGSGCGGGYTKTVRVEERVRPAEPASPPERIAIVTETTTVQQPSPHRGVLSSTVHFIGEVLALPFRLVGGLLRAIF